MNIAHIRYYDSNQVNGVSYSACVIGEAQAKLGHNVYFYNIDTHENRYQISTGITVHNFSPNSLSLYLPKKFNFYLSKKMKQFLSLNKDNIDIFHLHSSFGPFNCMIAKILHKYRMKYIITPNGGYIKNVFQNNKLQKSLYYHFVDKKFLMNASGIICVTQKEIQDIRRLGYKGRICVIPNPVKNELYTQRSKNNNLRHSIVFLGRWDINHKGLDRLFELFKKIEHIDTSITLELYGGGGSRCEIEKIIQKLGIKNLNIHNPVYNNEKLDILKNASLYIQTSRWEVFGISIAEAMAIGVPVAISNDCYLSEYIEKEECGIVIQKYDTNTAQKIINIIKDSKRNVKLGENGKKYAVNNFQEMSVASNVVSFYQEILNN